MLEGVAADMKKDFPQTTGTTRKTPKPKDPKEEKAKALQKDIKAFLDRTNQLWQVEGSILVVCKRVNVAKLC